MILYCKWTGFIIGLIGDVSKGQVIHSNFFISVPQLIQFGQNDTSISMLIPIFLIRRQLSVKTRQAIPQQVVGYGKLWQVMLS
jgi:hypothetical protein